VNQDLWHSSAYLQSEQNKMKNITLLNATPSLDAIKPSLAAISNTTTMNLTSICTLSPQARALSSVLTSIVGTSITGLSSGSEAVFLVGWVCWFASLRNALVGVYQVYSVFRLELPEGGEHFFAFLDRFCLDFGFESWSHDFGSHGGPMDRQVSFFGWIGWAYTTLYSPPIQVMWLLENWNKASAGLKLARAIGVSVTALPSTFDTRARYGQALGRLCGWPAAWVFGTLTATSTVTLTGVSVIELGLAAKGWDRSALWAPIYVFCLLIWTWGSLVHTSPHDGAMHLSGWANRLGGLSMGAFAGFFVAWPAFCVMTAAQNHPGLGLNAYVQCEGAAWWQKMVAVLP
jgi:hypothetical protein